MSGSKKNLIFRPSAWKREFSVKKGTNGAESSSRVSLEAAQLFFQDRSSRKPATRGRILGAVGKVSKSIGRTVTDDLHLF